MSSSENVTPITGWSDPALEREVLESISLDVPWRTIETLATLVRLSGSAEERQAVDFLIEQLRAWGISHQLYQTECFISIPLSASVRVLKPGRQDFRAKTVSMSVSTEDREIEGELVYLPSRQRAHVGDIFSAGVDPGAADVRGKIVLTDGMPFPGKVQDVAAAGALAGIFIAPGHYVHEGICMTIWGTPDLDSQGAFEHV